MAWMMLRIVRFDLRWLPLVLVALWGAECAWAQSVTGISVPLLLPSGIAFDASGNLYIAELQAHRIRKVDSGGKITVVAGSGVQGFSGDGGPATAAELDSPTAVAVGGNGEIYLCDSHNVRVRRVDATTGVMTTVAGGGVTAVSGARGLATAADLGLPVGLAADSAGNLWIADAAGHRILRVDAATGLIRTVAGGGAQGFSGDGGPAVSAWIDTPTSLAVDSAGNVFLADAHNHRVRRIDGASGVITTVAGGGSLDGSTAGGSALGVRLVLPRGVSLDQAGRLYVADAGVQRVLLLDVGAGTMQAVAGSGVEGYSGDQGGPLSATVDGPRGTAVSPGGLLTIADTENGRVRQLTAAPVITTIVGGGSSEASLSPSTLLLAGASTAVYGTGSVTGELTTAGSAAGAMTLMDGGVAVGTSAVTSNAATFSTEMFSAGTHTVSVSYSGDSTHAAATSPASVLTVSAAPMTVVVHGATTVYGAVLPGLTGTVSGLLAQDTSRVTVTFGTTATQGSAVGGYPIVAGVGGQAAANYSVAMTPGVLTVAKAGSVPSVAKVLVASGTTTLTATIAVGSATTGRPTGSVTLLDGGTPIAAGAVGSDGTVTLGSGSLASGTHVLTAFYSGDGNFMASTSAGTSVSLGGGSPTQAAAADFALTCTGASTQIVAAGAPASFGLWAQWTGATMSSPVTLSVSGLPMYATAAFNPPYLPPGGDVSAFTMTVTMPVQAAAQCAVRGQGTGWGTAALGLCLPLLLAGRRRELRGLGRQVLGVLCLSAVLLGVSGCGDRVRTAGETGGVTSRSYPLIVTGTATDASGATMQRTVGLTLVVQSSQ